MGFLHFPPKLLIGHEGVVHQSRVKWIVSWKRIVCLGQAWMAMLTSPSWLLVTTKKGFGAGNESWTVISQPCMAAVNLHSGKFKNLLQMLVANLTMTVMLIELNMRWCAKRMPGILQLWFSQSRDQPYLLLRQETTRNVWYQNVQCWIVKTCHCFHYFKYIQYCSIVHFVHPYFLFVMDIAIGMLLRLQEPCKCPEGRNWGCLSNKPCFVQHSCREVVAS